MSNDGRYDVARITVDGAPAFLHLAAPDAIDLGPQVGIYYEQIPGAGDVQQAPSLAIEGDSRGFNDQELLATVLTSVRYAAIDELPRLPTQAFLVPGHDFEPVQVRSGSPSFSLLLPPGWQVEELQGIDSYVGRISGDGITLQYDFSGLGGTPFYHQGHARERPDVPMPFTWEEQIDGRSFWFVRPVAAGPDPRSETGVYVDLGKPGGRLSIYGFGLNTEQQHLVLVILRTLKSGGEGA